MMKIDNCFSSGPSGIINNNGKFIYVLLRFEIGYAKVRHLMGMSVSNNEGSKASLDLVRRSRMLRSLLPAAKCPALKGGPRYELLNFIK